MNTVYITISIFLALLLTIIFYLIYASAYLKWPFQNARQDDKKDVKGQMDIQTDSDSTKNMSTGEKVFMVIMFIIFFGFFIVLAYFSIKSSMYRYELASDAMKKGKTGIAAAALAPEIGEGIGDVIYGNRRYN